MFFRKLRMEFIENRLKRVLENHTEGLTGPTDTIEEGVMGRKRKREEHPVVTSRIQVDPYNFVDHYHGGKPTVIVGNPVAKNSCSFESVKDVFKTIKSETTGEEGGRSLGAMACPILSGIRSLDKKKTCKTSFLCQDLVTLK